MNHEEHVSQLKSEVRYIQEVATSAGGWWRGAAHSACGAPRGAHGSKLAAGLNPPVC